MRKPAKPGARRKSQQKAQKPFHNRSLCSCPWAVPGGLHWMPVVCARQRVLQRKLGRILSRRHMTRDTPRGKRDDRPPSKTYPLNKRQRRLITDALNHALSTSQELTVMMADARSEIKTAPNVSERRASAVVIALRSMPKPRGMSDYVRIKNQKEAFALAKEIETTFSARFCSEAADHSLTSPKSEKSGSA